MPDPQIETVQHPTLGPLKFPMDMGPDERNEAIDRAMMDKAKNPAASVQRPNPIASATDVYLPDNASNPGASEGAGLREGLGEYVDRSAGDVLRGGTNIAKGNIAKGTHQILSGGMNATTPMLPFAAAGAPLAVARAGVGGYAGSKLARGGAETLGATPDQADVASDVGGIAGGIAGAKSGPTLRGIADSRIAKTTAGAIKGAAGRIPIVGPMGRGAIRGGLEAWKASGPEAIEAQPWRDATRMNLPYAGEEGGEEPGTQIWRDATRQNVPYAGEERGLALGGKASEAIPAKPSGRLVLSPAEAQAEARQMAIAKRTASQRGMQYAAGIRPKALE